MKLLDKQKVTVQVYPGRQFGIVIGSHEGLIGILLNTGEYIDVLVEQVRIVSEEVEEDEIQCKKVCPDCRPYMQKAGA